MNSIKMSDIKPIGNFDKVLTSIRNRADEDINKAHALKAYHKGIADTIKLICNTLGIIDVLEDSYKNGETWSVEENLQCLLYTHLIIIDLNQVAHTYLNNVTKWDSPAKQLQDLIDGEPEIYKGLKIQDNVTIDYSTVKVEGIDTKDFPDFSDAFASYAEYEDGTELTDDELEKIDVNSIIHDNQLYM